MVLLAVVADVDDHGVVQHRSAAGGLGGIGEASGDAGDLAHLQPGDIGDRLTQRRVPGGPVMHVMPRDGGHRGVSEGEAAPGARADDGDVGEPVDESTGGQVQMRAETRDRREPTAGRRRRGDGHGLEASLGELQRFDGTPEGLELSRLDGGEPTFRESRLHVISKKLE